MRDSSPFSSYSYQVVDHFKYSLLHKLMFRISWASHYRKSEVLDVNSGLIQMYNTALSSYNIDNY